MYISKKYIAANLLLIILCCIFLLTPYNAQSNGKPECCLYLPDPLPFPPKLMAGVVKNNQNRRAVKIMGILTSKEPPTISVLYVLMKGSLIDMKDKNISFTFVSPNHDTGFDDIQKGDHILLIPVSLYNKDAAKSMYDFVRLPVR